MRIASILAVAALLASPAAADTIRLKNGRVITADRVREAGGRVEYEIGDNTYAISRSSVERIDTSSAASGTGPEAVEAIRPSQEFAGPTSLPAAIAAGKLDASELLKIEAAGNARNSAAAYYFASRAEANAGRFEKARVHLERAIYFMPESALLQEHMASLLLRMGRFADALAAAERATRMDENSADGFALLGFAYLQTDRTRDAVRAWQRSLQIKPNEQVREYLARAERELKAEDGFHEEASSHFSLRFEGARTSESLRRQVLATLESHYHQLAGTLGISPRENIAVILYTGQAFFDVTQAPQWSAAINDGRIRIPVEGMEAVTPELSRVLAHELAHSFITQITRGRAPQWLHEGVAQLIEPKSAAAHGHLLHRLFSTNTHVPFQVLESSYAQLPQQQASIAYAQSLVAVEYIRDTYGMSDVVRVLVRIGEGMSTEAALRATIRGGYADLERDLAAYLKRRYAN